MIPMARSGIVKPTGFTAGFGVGVTGIVRFEIFTDGILRVLFGTARVVFNGARVTGDNVFIGNVSHGSGVIQTGEPHVGDVVVGTVVTVGAG